MNSKHTLELICRLPDAAKSINCIVSDDHDLLVSNGNIYRIDLNKKQQIALSAVGHLAPFISMFRNGNSLY